MVNLDSWDRTGFTLFGKGKYVNSIYFFFKINLEMTSHRKKTSHTFQFQAKRSKKLFLPNKKVQ